MYGGVPLVYLESAAENKLEKMVCKSETLCTFVKVGGRSALGVVQITRFVAHGHEAPFNLPLSDAFAAGTNLHADALQLLPVGGEDDDRRRLGDALLAFLCPAPSLPHQP
jgi:hypothetical protein